MTVSSNYILNQEKGKLNPKDISFQTRTLSLGFIVTRFTTSPPKIILHPDFQRHIVWDNTEQSRFIESALMQFPLPAFYFDGRKEEAWDVIDGLQRLTAIKRFVVDKSLALEGLEYLSELNSMQFDDLPIKLQRRLLETQLTAFIIEAGTPQEVMFSIFQRINTAGKSLNKQEIRHALHQGIAADLLKELAESAVFKQATSNAFKSLRMEDRAMVTRFIALYLTPELVKQMDFDSFLNKGLEQLKHLDKQTLHSLKHNFKAAMQTAYTIFGKNAFRKPPKALSTQTNRINKALFDTWAVNLALLTEQERLLLVNKRDEVATAFRELIEKDKNFGKSIIKANKNIEERLFIIKQLIQKILTDD